MKADPQLLTYEQVAERLQVSVRTVRRMRAKKQLRCVDVSHSTKRFRSADVDSALARMAGVSTPEF